MSDFKKDLPLRPDSKKRWFGLLAVVMAFSRGAFAAGFVIPPGGIAPGEVQPGEAIATE